MGSVDNTAIRHSALRTQEQATINSFNGHLAKLNEKYDSVRVNGETSGDANNEDLRNLISQLKSDFRVIRNDTRFTNQDADIVSRYSVMIKAAEYLSDADANLDVPVSRTSDRLLSSARLNLEDIQRNLRKL